MIKKRLSLIGALCLFLISPNHGQRSDSIAYLESFTRWQSELSQSRKGYLQLAALCKLKKDTTSFGRAIGCDCRPESDVPDTQLGSFIIGKEGIHFHPAEATDITLGEEKLGAPVRVVLNDGGDSDVFKSGNLTWKIITRGGGYYIRAYDKLHPAVEAFKGFERFPVNSGQIYEATFTYFDTPKRADVDSRIGVPQQWEFIGQLSFEHKGKSYTLDVSEHGFTMVRDLTSGDSTYGGGRYIYVDLPASDGPVQLDFNKLYNPPCAFSEYTTCLLPPVQNSLDFEVRAGETITLRTPQAK